MAKGEVSDKFADAVIDCIGKGVVYYTNLPTAEGSPNNKRKGSGVGTTATT